MRLQRGSDSGDERDSAVGSDRCSQDSFINDATQQEEDDDMLYAEVDMDQGSDLSQLPRGMQRSSFLASVMNFGKQGGRAEDFEAAYRGKMKRGRPAHDRPDDSPASSWWVRHPSSSIMLVATISFPAVLLCRFFFPVSSSTGRTK